MMSPMETLVKAYEEAKSDLLSAVKALAQAQQSETSARNRVNNAQKAIDAAITEMRKEAPSDSDWGNMKKNYEPADDL